jgi:hypothetical protein
MLHADCVEYAQVSVPADRAACNAVTALDDSTACEAVMRAADAAFGACVFVESSCSRDMAGIRGHVFPETPLDSTFVDASPFAFEADPVSYFMGESDVPGTISISLERVFDNMCYELENGEAASLVHLGPDDGAWQDDWGRDGRSWMGYISDAESNEITLCA